jgi:hypothetical protein
MTIVAIPTKRIRDWASFHNAWIDCMTSLDDPDAAMSRVHAQGGRVLVLQLDDVDDFAARCPEQYAAILEASAFVNWRRIEQGHAAVLALSFFKRP